MSPVRFEATQVSVESESSCCESDCCESDAPATPESPPTRSCGTCADVCAGVFKPGDDVNAPISLLSMLPAIDAAPTSIHLRHSVVEVDSTSLPDKLPFPLSDVPLLI